MNNSMLTKLAMWAAVILVLVMVFNKFDGKNAATGAVAMPYSQFLDEVRAKRIKEALIDDSNRTVVATTIDDKKVKAQLTIFDNVPG